MTMTQSTKPSTESFNGVLEKDDTAWRAKNGYTGTPSQLQVMRYVGGKHLWIGTGSPNTQFSGVASGDQAFNTTTGRTYVYSGSSTTWYGNSYTSGL